LLLTIVGIGVAIGLAEKFLIRPHPDHYIALGDQAMKDRNWQEAVNNFAIAARIDPKDARIQLRLAAALANTVQTNPEAIRQELTAYTQALEIDPKCMPALKALSDFFTRRAAGGFDASDFTNAIKYSRQAHDADPTDETMQTRADELVIQQWINGFNPNQSDVDQAVKDLKALWQKNPADADLPYWLARAEIEQGSQIAGQNAVNHQLREVTDHYGKAIAIFESVLTGPKMGSQVGGSQDGNAAMHLNFARILMQLSQLDESTRDISKADNDRAGAEIERARALVKPADPQYADINSFAADMAMRRGDPNAAIAIYKAMPDSLQRDVSMADLMCRIPQMQAEAVTMLKTAISSLADDPNHVQYYSARFILMMELCKAQVYQYLLMKPSPQRSALHDEIRPTLDKLDQIAGVRDCYPLADIEGRFGVYSGGEEEMSEVQKLNKLMTNDAPPKKDIVWYSLQTLLAQGYEDTNQASNAVAILRDVVQQYPKDIDSRKHLIKLLLAEHPDEVPAHVAALERQAPDDPMLNIFKIQMLLSDPEKNKDIISAAYGKLHEDTAGQMGVKARVAFAVKNLDECERLLRGSTAKDPTNTADWIMLSEILLSEKKKDQALDVASKGLAANPTDARLRILIPQIKGEGQKAIEDLEKQIVQENPDKSQSELGLAAIAARNGDFDGEGIHLKNAEKISPDNPRIQDLLFNYYLRGKQFDQATNCIPKLAKLDVDHASGELYRLALAEAQGDNATAETIARKLTQDKPEFARSWLALGDVLRAKQQYAQAIPQYQVARDKESNLVEAYVGLAQCYYGLNRKDDALHIIDDGLSRLPNNQMLHQMRLTHQLNYGQANVAKAELEDEINKNPSPDLYAALADVLLRYSQQLRQNHEDDKSVEQAQIAIAALEKPIDVLKQWPDESELYVTKSQCQLAAGKIQDAVDTLVAWSNRDAWKHQPAPYLAMSQTLETLGFHDRAEEQMLTALQESGYQVDYQIRMASLLSLHKKYDAALHLLHGTNADNPDVKEKIIQILIVAGRFDEAQDELKSDLAKNPPDAEQLLRTWALALYEHGKYDDAVDKATQALAINPHDQTVLFCRARSRLHLQPPDALGAMQDLEVVRAASPKSAEVRICLADAHLILNQIDEAAGELQAGLRLLPNDKPLRMKLVDIFVNGPHPRYTQALKALQDVEGVKPFDKDPDIYQNEAVVYSKMKKTDQALLKSEAALKLAPDDETVVRTNYQLLGDAKDYQGIVDHYATISPKLKNASWALWDLALAEKQLGNDQALPDIKRALVASEKEDDPVELDSIARSMATDFSYDEAVDSLVPMSKESISAKISLARIYQSHGDDSAALATIDELMASSDKFSHRDKINLYTQAAIMYQLAKPAPLPDKAYNAYQLWLKIDPENMEALNNLACLMADNYPPERGQEGLQYANEAVNQMGRLGRTEPRLLDTQAWLLILTGSPDQGIHTLNTIMEGFDPFPDEYLHLGEGYLRTAMPNPVEAENQAKLGLQMVNKRNGGDVDGSLRAKLQDLINRSEAMRRAKPQQAQAP
jgi:predicted Zn-dependent protease